MNRFENIFACLCAGLLLTAGRGFAETVFWSDNFETNAGSRWTTNGVWQIGLPTFGPAAAHSGSHCGTTGLKTSAPANADARFICTNYNGTNFLTVPAANQSPRLRFWQWFNFVNSGGYVEILAAGGTNWQAISATNISVGSTANYGSGVWSRPSIDLGAFAGQNVQIAFHFFSGGSGWGSDPGWYVDDVAVVTNAPVFNNPENFEAGLGDWSVDSGTWEVGVPTSGPPLTNGFRAHAGTNCAGTVLAGNYGWNVDTRLISPPFQVPAAAAPVLRYWQWYSFVNAGGFVEINTGITSTTATTNNTIITNVVSVSLNTNIYQLAGALTVGYATPFYWNSTIAQWTNGTKAMGNVNDALFAGGYYFEAGNAPLVSPVNVLQDYYSFTNLPVPRTAAATNFLSWQGMQWTNLNNSLDVPFGYFGTNYTYSYTTNTTVTFTKNNWLAISPTNLSVGSAAIASGGWKIAAVDLSAYAGQTVQVAFHFFSGGSGWGNASGWYVDDVALVEGPMLTVPTNQTIHAGQTFVLTVSATNAFLTNSVFTFGLPSVSTNVVITTNGVLTWTNTAARPGTNVIYVTVSDNSVPPLSATNYFSVIVLPAAPILIVSNTLPGGHAFRFSFQTQSNLAWRIDASTNLLNWLPLFTNTGGGGTLQFTDLLATNFPLRFYRAVSP